MEGATEPSINWLQPNSHSISLIFRFVSDFLASQSTQSNDISVEQHRLKCTLANDLTSSAYTDVTRNGNLHTTNGPLPLDGDRQLTHITNSVRGLE